MLGFSEISEINNKLNRKITDSYHSGLLKINGVKEGLNNKITPYKIHLVKGSTGDTVNKQDLENRNKKNDN